LRDRSCQGERGRHTLIDTVLDLDDFKRVVSQFGWCKYKDSIRVCVQHEPVSEYWVKCQVTVSVGLPDRLLLCRVSQASFNYTFLQSDFETHDKKRYKEWVEAAYKKVEETLGFKPIEGLWSEEKK